jgi:putative ubiquitin-RnfH superfamily antitoxin RatB of RatAB toxin-antitoxin module
LWMYEKMAASPKEIRKSRAACMAKKGAYDVVPT